MSASPKTRSRLFAAGAEPANNEILARTLVKEMVRNGRTRADMIDFVNCFLGLLVADSERDPGGLTVPHVDPITGLPNRRALHDLLRHELDPQNQRNVSSALVMVQLTRTVDPEIAAKVLKHRLRGGDVLAALGLDRIGIIAYVPEVGLPSVIGRLTSALSEHPKLMIREPKIVALPLIRGTAPREVWRRILKMTRER